MSKRLYFSNVLPAGISVEFDQNWITTLRTWSTYTGDDVIYSDSLQSYALRSFKGDETVESGQVVSWSSFSGGTSYGIGMDRQYISAPLAEQKLWRMNDAAININNNSPMFSGMLSLKQMNASYSVKEIWTTLYIVNQNGIVRTILATADDRNDKAILRADDFYAQCVTSGSTSWSGSGGDWVGTGNGAYDYFPINRGDRIVFEVGYQGLDSPAVTEQVTALWGDGELDLPYIGSNWPANQIAGSGYCGWIEFLQDIEFEDSPNFGHILVSGESEFSSSARVESDNIQYNVYSAPTENGPWAKANTFPITNNPEGNSCTVRDLTNDSKYYMMVVGGYLDDNDEFLPVAGQPIQPNPEAGIEIINPNMIVVKPKKM